MKNKIFKAIKNSIRRKSNILIVLALTSFFHINAQEMEKEKPPLKDRIYFGGNIGLVVGTITHIEIAPIVGYRFSPKFSSGVGLIYNYYKQKSFLTYETNIYGSNVFSRYRFIDDLNKVIPLGSNASIIGHVEYEALSLETKYFDTMKLYTGQPRFISHNVWVGGGLGLPMGERSAFNIFILWNLNEDSNSLQSSPIIRVGFNF